MREPLLQEGVPDIGQFLLFQSFDYLKGECGLAMGRPCELQAMVDVAARPQREPDTILDLVHVERLSDPDFSGKAATQGINSGDTCSLLVVGNGELSRFGFHDGLRRWALSLFIPGCY